MDVKTLIKQLNLIRHPEGGYYRETFRSTQNIHTESHTVKSAGTVIYFLLENEQKSHFHRIQSDETWYFHQGSSIKIITIINEELHLFLLGNDIANNELPQITIPANTWFAAQIKSGKGYALVSCSVAPGFEFNDFELAEREKMLDQYPHCEEAITYFTS